MSTRAENQVRKAPRGSHRACHSVNTFHLSVTMESGFYCTKCTNTSHPIEHAIDNSTATSWISPPLSRGKEWEQVNITMMFKNVRNYLG